MSNTEFINLSEIYLPTAGGSIDGDVEVGGALQVNDGSGEGTTYDVASEITELKSAWDSVSQTYGKNKILWSDALYMNADHTVTLSEAISAQPHGIVLAWSGYKEGRAVNYNWYYHFIPKHHIEKHNGTGVTMNMITPAWSVVGSKYVYISDTNIVGYSDNINSGTGASGITYNNKYWVLRYVIGV